MEATATTTNTKTTMTIKVRYVAANPVCNKRQKPQATQVFARVPPGIFLHYGLSSLPFSAVTDAANVRP